MQNPIKFAKKLQSFYYTKTIMKHPISTNFTDFQRQIINSLSYFSVSLTTVEKTVDGSYRLVSDDLGRAILYCIIVLNNIIKLFYLILLVLGYFGPIDFLDRMCALLWILMCVEIFQELLFYCKKYPLFEVLKELWRLENEIFKRLGYPDKVKQKCDRLNLQSALFHLVIMITGCIVIAVQFNYAPKYTVYTYAAFKEDNLFLLVLFTCHEVCFMWQAWTGYLSIVTISSVNAVELACILDGMTKALNSIDPTNSFIPIKKSNQIEKLEKFPTLRCATDSLEKSNISVSSTTDHVTATFKSHPMHAKYLGKVSPGTEYTSYRLIADYKNLMLTSDLVNQWCSYRIVGLHAIGYVQFCCDVFMMMQLIKLPEMDVPAVLWFGQDASTCLCMLFRMFTLMSRVAPASETFQRAVQRYLGHENPMRKEFKKSLKALRIISLKLGPCPVQPGTVGTAVMMLLNYYLVVALWKSN